MDSELDPFEGNEAEEPDPAFVDSYWSRGRKHVTEGWRRDADGITSELFVTGHGRYGAEINLVMRPERVSGSSCQITYLMTTSDMGHLIRILTGQIIKVARNNDDEGEQLRAARAVLSACENEIRHAQLASDES